LVALAVSSEGAAPAAAGAAAARSEPIKSVPRKIIYTAQVELVTEDFTKAEAAVARLVPRFDGYLAQAQVAGSPGEPRSGSWKVRVPVARFEAFLEAVLGLGELITRRTDSQDVTEEFFDLEARIKNKKVEESRLLEHLEKSTGELKDILEVEREISRVRGEIEQLEGRRQLLSNLSDLTTVTISIQERRGFVPTEAPGFGTSVARTFRASLDALVAFGQAVVLFVVAVGPWLPLLVVVVLVFRWLVRRLWASSRDHPPAVGRPAG
jgi:hypothetical protein